MAPGAAALESSTVTPDWVAELGAAAAAAGVRLLDAPVAGSTPQAEAGALAYLVGGDAETLAEVRPVLDAMGRVVVHAGGPGRGAVLKLMVNALFATQVAVVAELLQLAERHGLPAAEAAELLGPLPVTSPAARGAAALMVAGDHASRFPVRLVAKDLRYAVAAGAGPVVDAARARFDAIADAGGADDNLTVVHRHR
jgi:3-hydroxyisobutyrate dehydrogenase-like beta-hydroxyacid dehydrogenase